MILAAFLFAIIILLLGLVIVFLNEVFLPSILKDKNKTFDPIISFAERNYIVPERKEFDVSEKKAFVLCNCNKSFDIMPSVLSEHYTCFMVKSVQGSGTDCKYACIGQGDCAKICPQQAITIVNHTAKITNLCCGCGKCVDICPQKLIQLVDKNTRTIVCCNNTNTEELTSCTNRIKSENVEWQEKKDFKIWSSCYKLFNRLKK